MSAVPRLCVRNTFILCFQGTWPWKIQTTQPQTNLYSPSHRNVFADTTDTVAPDLYTPHLSHIWISKMNIVNLTLPEPPSHSNGCHYRAPENNSSPNLLCFLGCKRAKLPRYTSHLPTKILWTDPQGLSDPILQVNQNMIIRKRWKI